MLTLCQDDRVAPVNVKRAYIPSVIAKMNQVLAALRFKYVLYSETAKNFIYPDNGFVLEGWQLDSLRQAQQYSP